MKLFLLLLLVITGVYFILKEAARLVIYPRGEAARVIVIVKDQEQWLEGFIQKLFRCISNKQYLEVLIVDDHSLDSTREVLRILQKRYPFELLRVKTENDAAAFAGFMEEESEYKKSFCYDVRYLKGRELLNAPLFCHLSQLNAGKIQILSK